MRRRLLALLWSRALKGVAPAICILLTFLPVVSHAQQGSEGTGRGKEETGESRPLRKKTEKLPPPPDNPLVLRNPEKGTGNAADVVNDRGERVAPEYAPREDLGNYRQINRDPRVARRDLSKLPVFGYDFFAPARDFIRARRAYYQRLYGYPVARAGRGEDRPDAARERVAERGREDPESPRGKRGPEDPRDVAAGRAAGDRKEREPEPEEEPRDARTKRADVPERDPMEEESDATRSPGRVQRPQGSRDGDAPGREGAPDERRPVAEREARRQQVGGLREDGEPAARSRREEPDPGPVNAFHEADDPFSHLFRNVIASVPDTYQLSSGDKVTVRYMSPTLAEREFTGTVDALGTLNIDNLTRVVVRGLTLDAAQKLIQNKLRSFYKNVEVTVNLKELRTISVTVAGEAFNPTTYTVPSTFTAFNLLYLAGGPSDRGSLRRIEVRRQGRLVGVLDFYHLMRGAGTQHAAQGDIALQSGDILYVPPRESAVAVGGEVRMPAVYELIEGETLADALRYAGGIKASGVRQSVQINTLDPGRTRVLRNVDIKDLTAADRYPLYDGDTVEVFSVREILANKVSIEGAVDVPGDYALTAGMRVSDLLELARGPSDEAVLTQADLYRWNPDNSTTLIPINLEKALARDPAHNIPLERWDRIRVYSRSEVAWTGHRRVTVRGAVQRPGTYIRSENMRVMDLLRQVGGPAPDAYLDRAVLLHQHGDGTYRYEYFSIADAQAGKPDQNPLVQDNDLLVVYRVGEAQFTPERVVRIEGAVLAPGVYPRGEGMKLSELIALAGGFRPDAGGSVVVAHARKVVDMPDTMQRRVTVVFNRQGQCAPEDDIVLEDGDVVAVQGTGGFVEHVQRVYVKGAVHKPGPVLLSSKKVRLSDAIREAGGLRPEAFPEGAEFFRNPQLMASEGQRSLARTISELNNLLNESEFRRLLAKSDIARIQAAGQASQESAPLPIPGLGGGQSAPNPAATVLATELSRRELVTRPRVLTEAELDPNGAIAVNLPEALRRPGGGDDILLMDGDTIHIPEKPTTVLVTGAVISRRGVLYRPGARLDYYIAQAGGYAPDAARDNIVIIRANSGTVPASKVRTLRPGDVILVPTRVLAAELKTRNSALDSLLRSVTSSLLLFRLFGL
ncbi:MAG: SLBB domain-containing protein [Chloroherpetonaceae bacterium]|nr:SLBB domain-containing protein [Chthonomonadaceae bacterium]MDW8208283.1 SLBB domain-containing protein [Chloroherpetonaceae bacterium]